MKKIIPDIEVHTEHELLDQYQNSEHFRQRLYIAAHTPGDEIIRSIKTTKKVETDKSEIKDEALGYFIKNRKKLISQYFYELEDLIDNNKKVKYFVDTVSKEWADGKSKRLGKDVNGIRLAIREYIHQYYQSINDEIMDFLPEMKEYNKVLSGEDISEILQLNKQWLTRQLYKWQNEHPEVNFLSTNSIYLRRGLGLSKKNMEQIEKGDKRLYVEWDYINSYSLAISTPEQFTQIQKDSVPVIVNMSYSHLEEHILFFSPFIEGMSINQFEFGVIPRSQPEVLIYQGEIGGVHEFLLE